MTTSFSLTAGTTLRCGTRTLAIVRQLNDTEVMLEDELTRRPEVKRKAELINDIWKGTYAIAGHVLNAATPRDKTLALTAPSLASLTPEQIAVVDLRMAYIRGVFAAKATRGQRNRINSAIQATHARRKQEAATRGERFKEKRPTPSTVMRWIRIYQTDGVGPAALINRYYRRRGLRRLELAVDALLQRVIREVYLTRDRNSMQRTLDVFHEELDRQRAAAGLAKHPRQRIAMATLSRRINDIDMYTRIRAREGESRARHVCRTTMDGAHAYYPLQRVEIDHTVLNWVVLCDVTHLPLGRPVLTVMIDAMSNYVVGFYLSFNSPGLTAVSGVLRNAIMPKDELVNLAGTSNRWLAEGVPDQFVHDNGVEFHSAAFKLMAWELGSDLKVCRVRTPWLKPHVERFFGTLDYLTLCKGRVRPQVANMMRIDPMKDAAIRFSDLVKGLVMFMTDVHPFQINERKLARPYDLFSEGLQRNPPARFPGSWEDLKLVSALSQRRKVNQGGVQIEGLPYGGPELRPLLRRRGDSIETLIKLDPDDLGSIYVQDPRTSQWITSACRWPEAAVGISYNQHKLMRKFARAELAAKDAREQLRCARLRLSEHWLESVSHKTQKSALLAGRFSGVTSARVTAEAHPLVDATRLIHTPLKSDKDAPKEATTEPVIYESFTF